MEIRILNPPLCSIIIGMIELIYDHINLLSVDSIVSIMAREKKGRRRGALDNLMSQLVNPKNTRLSWVLAILLLVGESVLLTIIIRKVPCELDGMRPVAF